MPLVLLAQETQPDFWRSLTEGPTEIFGRAVQHPPVVAIPVFLAILAVASVVIERVAALILRRVTSRTQTTVDDALIAGLPRLVRAVLVFVALQVIASALTEGDSLVRLTQVIHALAIVVVGIVLVNIGLRMTDAWVTDRPHVRPAGPGVKLALKVLAIPVLLVTVLDTFGVEIKTFLTVLGVGSLAVALALQDVLKNIFSGIQLVVDQPIRAGDFIALDDGRIRGVVLEVGLRSTRLRTVDNNVIVVPNANLAGAVITNMDVMDPLYAHAITVGVAYGSDTRRVERILQEVADRAMAEVPGFAEGPAVVQFVAMADFALNFRIVVRLTQYAGYFGPVGELQHRIYERLEQEGIEIPFPTRTLHVKNVG